MATKGMSFKDFIKMEEDEDTTEYEVKKSVTKYYVKTVEASNKDDAIEEADKSVQDWEMVGDEDVIFEAEEI